MVGIIVVNKEKDFTSFDVVAKLRGILKQKKIGHTGTLDPMATGVLPVCLGSATKLCDMLTDKRKEYIAEFVLGKSTDTQDIWGQVLSEQEVSCTGDEVRDCLKQFEGDLMQVPPMYSAVWADGRRLYELARMGIEVERKARPVTIYEIEVLKIQLPYVTIRVQCSKGTYIRTLIDDIGKKLRCGATLTSLNRTMSGQFRLEESFTLKEIEEKRDQGKLDEVLIPVDRLFMDLPEIVLDSSLEKVLLNGNLIYKDSIQTMTKEQTDSFKDGQKFRIYIKKDNKRYFMAVYQYRPIRNGFVPFKMFLP